MGVANWVIPESTTKQHKQSNTAKSNGERAFRNSCHLRRPSRQRRPISRLETARTPPVRNDTKMQIATWLGIQATGRNWPIREVRLASAPNCSMLTPTKSQNLSAKVPANRLETRREGHTNNRRDNKNSNDSPQNTTNAAPQPDFYASPTWKQPKNVSSS